MELALIIYWTSFYSVLFGWYARTAPIIRSNRTIAFKRYMIPRVILPHVLSGYFLILLFYALSLLKDNRWVIIFAILSTLAATEYFWIRLGGIREKIAQSITVKICSLIIGGVIIFYFSSMSGTHIELMTKVSPSAFGPFEGLLTFLLSTVAWIVLLQLLLTAGSLIYIVKLFLDKDDYIENLLFVFASGLTASFFLVLAIDVIFKSAIPYLIDKKFVESMYHENKSLDEKIICTNRSVSDQIVFLPSGEISIATRREDGHWSFSVDVCDRTVDKASHSST